MSESESLDKDWRTSMLNALEVHKGYSLGSQSDFMTIRHKIYILKVSDNMWTGLEKLNMCEGMKREGGRVREGV